MKNSALFLVAMVSFGGLSSYSHKPFTLGHAPKPEHSADASMIRVLSAVRRVLASSRAQAMAARSQSAMGMIYRQSIDNGAMDLAFRTPLAGGGWRAVLSDRATGARYRVLLSEGRGGNLTLAQIQPLTREGS